MTHQLTFWTCALTLLSVLNHDQENGDAFWSLKGDKSLSAGSS